MAQHPALLDGGVSLFHTPIGSAYADIEIDQHRETWPIRSKQFRAWLRRRHYRQTGDALSAEAIKAVVDLLEARAQFDSPERAIHVRVAEYQDRIYLDLAEDAWQAVEIGSDGWRIIS